MALKKNVVVLSSREWWKQDRKPSDSLTVVRKKKVFSNQYYTVKSLAERFAVSVDTIYEAISKKRLEAERISTRRIRISHDAVVAWLELNERIGKR